MTGNRFSTLVAPKVLLNVTNAVFDGAFLTARLAQQLKTESEAKVGAKSDHTTRFGFERRNLLNSFQGDRESRRSQC